MEPIPWQPLFNSSLYFTANAVTCPIIESIINRTINYLQGGLARTVGVFCIIIAGYLCLARQKFPKEYFVMILVGMGIIFGGSTLYSTLIG
ncbi:TrbC/VirB2 family protein [Legionella pneumophila]|uniref:TrbC/VirB2 family protein n=1 Tax=Legionella pneumophila TaxID=446 RepID=UPI000ACEE272|nr:TrbC/VirB2 family protein [Legionella pneumophila]